MNSEELRDFLDEVKEDNEMRQQIEYLVRKKGSDVEKEIASLLNAFSEKKNWFFRFVFNGPQSFPDISVTDSEENPLELGVEIKTSHAGKLPGNSIMEDCSIPYENLFVLGIKYDRKSFDVHVGLYFDFVSAIRITHSPRFVMSFDKCSDSSYFKTMKDMLDYPGTIGEFVEEMRKDKKKLIANAYEVSGKDSFPDWVSSFPVEVDSSSEEIQHLLNPYPIDDSNLKAKGFVWCPILFSNSTKKNRWFEKRVLLEGYFPKTNTRDLFTASGQVEVRGVNCPHILSVFDDVNKEIIKHWKQIKCDTKLQSELQEFWNEQMNQGARKHYSFPLLFDRWKEMCVTLFTNYSTNKDKSPKGTRECVGLLDEIIGEMKKEI